MESADTILIVEDDEQLARLIGAYLSWSAPFNLKPLVRPVV